MLKMFFYVAIVMSAYQAFGSGISGRLWVSIHTVNDDYISHTYLHIKQDITEVHKYCLYRGRAMEAHVTVPSKFDTNTYVVLKPGQTYPYSELCNFSLLADKYNYEITGNSLQLKGSIGGSLYFHLNGTGETKIYPGL